MKIYCLWGSCSLFGSCHRDCIVTAKPACIMSLEGAKKEYPNYVFCEDWKEDSVESKNK